MSETFNVEKCGFETIEADLPIGVNCSQPILLVPKNWLRRNLFISPSDYFSQLQAKSGLVDLVDQLGQSWANYGQVSEFIGSKEMLSDACSLDPLFTPISIQSAKQRLIALKKLPTGKTDNADKQFEGFCGPLLSSMFYPSLDFAAQQVRTDSNSQIRDLFFYNTCNLPFLQDWRDNYDCKQIVFEIKNVKELELEHINQLNRYLAPHIGRVGVFVTRNEPPNKILKHAIDIWSGHRKCIIWLTEQDLEMMVTLFESKQRNPIDVLLKRYGEFIRKCPS